MGGGGQGGRSGSVTGGGAERQYSFRSPEEFGEPWLRERLPCSVKFQFKMCSWWSWWLGGLVTKDNDESINNANDDYNDNDKNTISVSNIDLNNEEDINNSNNNR